MRPCTGVSPSHIENSSCSRIASQNAAMASPLMVTTRTTWSSTELRDSAATTPSGTPTTTASVMAQIASSNVAGSLAHKSSATGRWVNRLVPMLPVATSRTYRANCQGSGRSRPYWRRSASTCSGGAFSPAITRAGSEGTTWEIANTSSTRPNRVSAASRRSAAPPWRGASWLGSPTAVDRLMSLHASPTLLPA